MSFPLDPSAYTTFIFYTGFAESGALSPVVISRSADFEDWKPAASWQEAWEVAFASLRSVFAEALTKRFAKESFQLGGCCRAAVTSAAFKYKFCPECGTKVATMDNTSPSEEDSVAFLSEIRELTNDDFLDMWEFTSDLGWTISGEIHPGYVTIVHSHAESLLVKYEHEKETYKWDKAAQFWTKETISIHTLG